MQEDKVILVDERDNVIGEMGKTEAHERGLLHRAISVFIFDDQNRLLLQQRAHHKYHSAGLWTNTCCSHPAVGESALAAAHRRLNEEMGLETDLQFAFNFQYRTAFDNGLIEHELDHVFIGHSDKEPLINTEEAAGYRWLSLAEIEQQIEENPESFTVWFKLIYQRVFGLSSQKFGP